MILGALVLIIEDFMIKLTGPETGRACAPFLFDSVTLSCPDSPPTSGTSHFHSPLLIPLLLPLPLKSASPRAPCLAHLLTSAKAIITFASEV